MFNSSSHFLDLSCIPPMQQMSPRWGYFVNPSGAVKLSFRHLEKSISPLTQIVHPHHLIPPWVDYLDCDALVFPGREGQRFGPTELLKPLCVNNAFECLAILSHAFLSGKNAWVMQKVRPS